ncbi:MAG: TonB-dependent receptor, partial [Alphaproteobacteria bacterium]|nr:TonB-dependent receptor [Alphaproteobacteria bacterium]
DSFEDFTTWSASGSLKMLQTPVRLHATVGEGVKYPSLFELFGSFPGGVFIANPNLTPEESFGWDAGVEIATPDRKALVDVTYFSQNLENEIDIDFLPTFASTAINRTGESKREGVEVAGHIEFGQGLRLGASYTYLKAREDDGSEEIRRPPHSGRLDVNYNFDQGRANLNLAAVYNGEMFDKAFNSNTFTALPVKLDEFLLLTAAASYKVTPGVEVYGRVENLLDEDYTEVVGINTAPIAAYAGLRFTYVEEQTRAWAEGR